MSGEAKKRTEKKNNDNDDMTKNNKATFSSAARSHPLIVMCIIFDRTVLYLVRRLKAQRRGSYGTEVKLVERRRNESGKQRSHRSVQKMLIFLIYTKTSQQQQHKLRRERSDKSHFERRKMKSSSPLHNWFKSDLVSKITIAHCDWSSTLLCWLLSDESDLKRATLYGDHDDSD